jgi:putative transposase
MEGPRTEYPTDIDDAQWASIALMIPPHGPTGAERVTSMRSVVNAILYRRRARCAWRMLPHDFPHWRTVYGYFRQWQGNGTWKRVEQSLRQSAPQDMASHTLLSAVCLPCSGRNDSKHAEFSEKS